MFTSLTASCVGNTSVHSGPHLGVTPPVLYLQPSQAVWGQTDSAGSPEAWVLVALPPTLCDLRLVTGPVSTSVDKAGTPSHCRWLQGSPLLAGRRPSIGGLGPTRSWTGVGAGRLGAAGGCAGASPPPSPPPTVPAAGPPGRRPWRGLGKPPPGPAIPAPAGVPRRRRPKGSARPRRRAPRRHGSRSPCPAAAALGRAGGDLWASGDPPIPPRRPRLYHPEVREEQRMRSGRQAAQAVNRRDSPRSSGFGVVLGEPG